MTFQQSKEDLIQEHVFPLAVLVPDQSRPEAYRLERMLGTGFVIGNNGFAMTAHHVTLNAPSDRIFALFPIPGGGGKVARVRVEAIESHPKLDLAVLKLEGKGWRSIFATASTDPNVTLHYRQWGYPEHVTRELVVNGVVLPRPDLVYVEGYVRRRYRGDLLAIRGKSFLELSALAGAGCSGGPISEVNLGRWRLIGVYVGEKVSDGEIMVGYAVPIYEFRAWVPKLCGRALAEELDS